MALKIQLRRGTAAEWTSANPTLMQGEMGVETDTLKVKLGNGTTAWTSLPYFTQGAKGDTGATGATGPQGIKGDKGDIGDTGPANTITMGTVTTGPAGSSASATVTGTAPNQTLNLVIPKGDKGDTGTAATITVGTVTALSPGSNPTVQNVGTSGAAVFNFGIPNAVGVPTGGTTGQIIKKTASATEWATNDLDGLSDVTIASPSNGQALTYDSATSSWKNATPANNLSQLGDVTIATPADKQVLQYESSSGKWKNKTATGGVTVGSSNPASPIDGDGWFYSEDGTLFVRYNDGNSTQWVQPNAVLSSQIEQRYYSPNYVINGGFDIWQRATSTTTAAAAYRTADRWATWIDSGSGTISQDTTNVPAFLQYGIRFTSSGASGSCVFYHTIETMNAELLAGKTVNLSAYLTGTNGKSIQVSLWSSTTTDNVFTGTWSLVGATAYTASTTTARVSATYTVPANAKTIQVRVYNLDKLANTEFLSFTGVQLEEGTTATTFRRNAGSVQGELDACMRYFYRINGGTADGGLVQGQFYSATELWCTVTHPVPMRVCPTASAGTINTFRVYAGGGGDRGFSSFTTYGTSSAQTMSITIRFVVPNGTTAGVGGWAAGIGAYVQFDAEL